MHSNRDIGALQDMDDFELVDQNQDLRGKSLFDATGRRFGKVKRMLVDREQERVAALVLDDGATVPIEFVEIRQDGAILNTDATSTSHNEIEATEMGVDEDRQAGMSTLHQDAPPPLDASGADVRVPVIEEDIAVGKREVERGSIRVRSRVIAEPVQEQISLREERISVERQPVDAVINDPEALFQDRTVELTATGEEAVVEKKARVTEEVVIRKEQGERVETIDETVRRTEVDVDRGPEERRR